MSTVVVLQVVLLRVFAGMVLQKAQCDCGACQRFCCTAAVSSCRALWIREGASQSVEKYKLNPAVFKDAFYFVLVSPPPGGSGGGSGLSFSIGNRWFWADAGPDPGETYFWYRVLH